MLRRVALVVGLVVVGLLGGASGAFAQEASPTSLSAPESAADKARDLRRAIGNRGASPDRVVVVYEANAGTSEVNPDRQRARLQAGGRLVRADTTLGSDIVRVSAADAATVAQRLRGLPGVRDAYPDPIARVAISYSDPRAGEEWGLARIQAPAVWDTTQGKNVRVAVLDCGVRASHPDLTGRVVLEQNFTGAPTADDGCNHGTHVAGTIAAAMNNATGVVGVAPGASLLNGKVLDDSGTGFFSDIDRGIQWAADNGARVINLSVNADIPCPSGTQSAINYAWSKGVVVVASAGNTALPTAGAPANCSNAVGVAASDRNDVVPSWSNQGLEVDVAAPGVDILSTVNPDLNGGALYNTLSGTSMAAPHVAGEAALLWSSMPAGTTTAALRDKLFSTSIKGAGSTYGRVSLEAAVGGVRDVAVGKPATESSTFGGADAGRAVDGNTNGDWAVGSLAHTNADPQAWWQVDLQALQPIDRVDVWNRTDCCGDRLSNFPIGVSDDGVAWAKVPVTAQAGAPTSTKIGRSARYVRVELKGTNYLGLAEVQVWPGGAAAGSNAFASAPLVGVVSTLTGSTSGATTEANEPSPCGATGKTVWYRFVPQATGTVIVDSTGSKFNTVLGVYTGSTLKNLAPVGCNDDVAGKQQAVVSVPVKAGQTYWVQLGGHGTASGAFSLTLSQQ